MSLKRFSEFDKIEEGVYQYQRDKSTKLYKATNNLEKSIDGLGQLVRVANTADDKKVLKVVKKFERCLKELKSLQTA